MRLRSIVGQAVNPAVVGLFDIVRSACAIVISCLWHAKWLCWTHGCCSLQCKEGWMWLMALCGHAVYLLEEIWDLVRTSSPDVVAGMVMYLNSRLANKSPIVKQKACLPSFP